MSIRFAGAALAAGLFVVACSPEELAERYRTMRAAANVLAGAICALPDDHPVRQRVRTDLAAIGYDSARVCTEGLEGLRRIPARPI